MKNKSQGANKEILASWLSKSLTLAFIESNIKSRLYAIGIWPYNLMAIETKIDPSKFYNSFLAPLVDHEIAVDLNDDNIIEYVAMEAVAIAAEEDLDKAPQLEATEDFELEPDFEGDYEAHLEIALVELEPWSTLLVRL